MKEAPLSRPARTFPATSPPFIYWVHQEDCIRCNACLEVCPVQCISAQKVGRVSDPKKK